MPRKRKLKNGWILWSLIALALLLVSIIGLYFILTIRLEQGWFTAEPWVVFLDHLFYGLMSATLIGWVVGSVISRTKRKR